MVPEVIEVLERECRELSGDSNQKRGKEKVHPMGDEVVVAQFHIFQFHRLLEIWKDAIGWDER